ncbi:MAG TPA: hypothetical protein VHJ34_11135 [Actinomycetota bacterium]|nr:hypothetical protein [Actinomycetota bacterium]
MYVDSRAILAIATRVVPALATSQATDTSTKGDRETSRLTLSSLGAVVGVVAGLLALALTRPARFSWAVTVLIFVMVGVVTAPAFVRSVGWRLDAYRDAPHDATFKLRRRTAVLMGVSAVTSVTMLAWQPPRAIESVVAIAMFLAIVVINIDLRKNKPGRRS